MSDRIMDISMGGEVASFIEKWQGTLIRCFGTCRKDRVMDKFAGYEHDAGLKDAAGRQWWVYFQCLKCKYGHSFAKMNFFLNHTEIEHKAQKRGLI